MLRRLHARLGLQRQELLPQRLILRLPPNPVQLLLPGSVVQRRRQSQGQRLPQQDLRFRPARQLPAALLAIQQLLRHNAPPRPLPVLRGPAFHQPASDILPARLDPLVPARADPVRLKVCVHRPPQGSLARVAHRDREADQLRDFRNAPVAPAGVQGKDLSADKGLAPVFRKRSRASRFTRASLLPRAAVR